MYQVTNGEIKRKSLPSRRKLSDGRTVSNYHKLPKDVLEQEGWLPLEEKKPEYDLDKERLVGPEYEIKEDKVVAHYQVKEKTINPKVEELRLNKLETEIMADGEDSANIRLTVEGTKVDELNCYVTVDGPPVEKVVIDGDGIVEVKITSEEPGLIRIDFYVLDKQATTFVEAKEVEKE